MKNLILNQPTTVNNYPYGRLQCEMTFSIEFVKGKGFRNVMQSVNPKNGRINAPKKSTYTDFMYMFQESESGHIKFSGLHITGYDSISKLIEILTNNTIEFTPEQSNHIWVCAIACIRNNASFTSLKEGATINDLLDATKVKQMIHLYKEGVDINQIKEIGFDLQTIKGLKVF